MKKTQYDVIIVGGGLAGLTAAIHLQNEGWNIKLVEAEDRVGGRIKTDEVNGFLLDRGFQVLLSSYPEAQDILDYEDLGLGLFYPGALVQYQGKLYRLADPFREPLDSFNSLFNPLSNIGDKVKILALRNRVRRFSIEKIFQQPETTTAELLASWNFSDRFTRTFFRPFMGGIFLENELRTTSRAFEFVFKMFSSGYATLPKNGMEAIPKQLAKKLKEDTFLLNTRVKSVENGAVTLANGETLTTRLVLLATDAPAAARLLKGKGDISNAVNGVKCLYFSADSSPVKEPVLVLNAAVQRSSLVNNLCVPNLIQSSYAPAGKYLISVTILKPFSGSEADLTEAVREELRDWFGEAACEWEFLRCYDIPAALPFQKTVSYPHKYDIKPFADGIYICGDYCHDASINGALRSGRITADAIAWDLSLHSKA